MRPSATARRGFVVASALVIAFAASTPALAQNIEGPLQSFIDLLTGDAARLLATIAVIFVGVLWLFGLFDLRRAGLVVLGIMVVFGAAEIVDLLTGGGG